MQSTKPTTRLLKVGKERSRNENQLQWTQCWSEGVRRFSHAISILRKNSPNCQKVMFSASLEPSSTEMIAKDIVRYCEPCYICESEVRCSNTINHVVIQVEDVSVSLTFLDELRQQASSSQHIAGQAIQDRDYICEFRCFSPSCIYLAEKSSRRHFKVYKS